jgi:uncharacterized repeat protein (TIGR03833 family)
VVNSNDRLDRLCREIGRIDFPARLDHDHSGKIASGIDQVKPLSMNGKNRADIKSGARVHVVQKKDQRSGKVTEGIVRDVLTNSPFHSHGIKVRLTNGIVGRVKEIL